MFEHVGTYYWIETVRDAEGEILSRGLCGAPGETTTVTEVPPPLPPQPPTDKLAFTGGGDWMLPFGIAAVREAYERGARIAAICSGAFVLAEAGLLDGRRATTHWMHANELAQKYPAVQVDASVLYLEDRGVHTSAGTSAAIDLCLDLVRRDRGAAVANALARRIVAPPHRAGGQAQYVTALVADDEGSRLSEIAGWARERLATRIRVRDLARRAHVSERTLIRWFEASFGYTPGAWLARERLRLAQELLETTELSIDRIAADCGFGSTAGLRAAFTRHVHTSPTEYRKAWAGANT